MNEFFFLLSTTLMYSTPLLFAALGGVLSEKSGVINIGLEGFMTLGAFAASWAAVTWDNPWIGLLAGGIAGVLLGFFHAFACIKLKANQVVSGMAINFLGPGLAIFLCRILFEGTSMTPPLNLEKKIPLFLGQYATTYLAFLAVFILWFIFNKTVAGLRLQSAGENPNAALAAGIKIHRYQYAGVLLSSFMAGLGGASLSIAIVSNFRPTLISGQGFIALAAMIFGKWKPVGTLYACLFFGLSQALVVFIGGLEGIVLSSSLLAMLPYLLTLLILAGFMGKSAPPSALGK